MTHDEWEAEGKRRFGPDIMKWRFVCPACGHVAATEDWQAAGAQSANVAFSCIGRWLPKCREAFGAAGPGPCNYAGGGLFSFSPIVIEGKAGRYFAFADPVDA